MNKLDDHRRFKFRDIKVGFFELAFEKFTQLPFAVKSRLLKKISSNINTLYPNFANRLNVIANKPIAFFPKNTNAGYKLVVDGSGVNISPIGSQSKQFFEVEIVCDLLDLLEVASGESDGDALFFSRGMRIEGNIETLVIIRNALENEDFEYTNIILGRFGLFEKSLTFALKFTERKIHSLENFADKFLFSRVDNVVKEVRELKSALQLFNRRLAKLERLKVSREISDEKN